MKPEIIFILNPLSRDQSAAEGWTLIKEILEEQEIKYRLLKSSENIAEAVYRFLARGETKDSIIAGIGGDGTHCAVINGIYKYVKEFPEAHVPAYSIIPLGTGNNLAKSLHVFSGSGPVGRDVLRRAILGAVHGADIKVDIGKIVDGLYFVNAFSAGFDAHALNGRNSDLKKLEGRRMLRFFLKGRGYLLYLHNSLKSLLRFKKFDLAVEVDGEKAYSGPAYNILLNNTRIYAGEFDLTRNAIPSDGKLDLLVSRGMHDYLRTYLAGIRWMPRMLRILLAPPDLKDRHFSGGKFSFRFSEAVPAQIDGEIVQSSDTFTIETVPSAVTFRIPVGPE